MKEKKSNHKILYFVILMCLIVLPFTNYSYAVQQVSSQTSGTEKIEIKDSNETTPEPTLLSKADILLDANTGNVLCEKNSEEKLYPASTTKLMTAILTMENCQMTDEITIEKEWLNGIPSGYTIAALQPGEKLTVDQLMHVLLIPSANDAANVLACHMSGNISSFAEKMNDKAIEIGCKNTHFVNPSGIHNDEHYSTAYDMALIGKYALQFDTIREIAMIKSYTLPDLPNGTKRIFKPTNTLITEKNQYFYEYATGLKTGYTDKAKSCIVATAKKDNVELLCVVLGGDKTEDKKAQRELDCKAMFEYGFNNYKYTDVCAKGDTFEKSEVTNLPEYLSDSTLLYSDSLKILTKNDEPIEPIIDFAEDIKLPIEKNTVIGTIKYKACGKDYIVEIVNEEDILPKSSISQNPIWIIISILILLFFVKIARKNKKRKKSSKYFRHSFY